MATSASKNFHPASEHELESEQKRYFIFFNLAVALTAITFIELICVILPFPGWVRTIVLVFTTVLKFGGVIWYFMHLRWDKYLLTLLFITGLSLAGLTLAVLLMLFKPNPGQEPPQIGRPPAAEAPAK